MEKISWTDRVKDGVARRVKGERDILHKIHKGAADDLVRSHVA